MGLLGRRYWLSLLMLSVGLRFVADLDPNHATGIAINRSLDLVGVGDPIANGVVSKRVGNYQIDCHRSLGLGELDAEHRRKVDVCQ